MSSVSIATPFVAPYFASFDDSNDYDDKDWREITDRDNRHSSVITLLG